jgi:hypothetical protein
VRTACVISRRQIHTVMYADLERKKRGAHMQACNSIIFSQTLSDLVLKAKGLGKK